MQQETHAFNFITRLLAKIAMPEFFCGAMVFTTHSHIHPPDLQTVRTNAATSVS